MEGTVFRYLTWKAREYDMHTRFIELAGEVNTAMPDYVLSRVVMALNDDKKSVNGSRILILRMAYKPDVDDDRESPSYVLMKKLEEQGAWVEYNDPYVPVIRKTREHPKYAGRKSVEITDNYDCILLATDHEVYRDLDFSKFSIPLIDTRNCLQLPPKKYYKA